MKQILSNLLEIEQWTKNAPDLAKFQNNDDFMKFTVELMNRCLYLLRLCASITPNEASSYSECGEYRAIVVGHLVRIVKLYEGSLMHISKRQLELATIFNRLIFETAIRMRYMMKAKLKAKSTQSFILGSYKPEKQILIDLKTKSERRPLMNIEKRMKRKVSARLKQDGLSEADLMNNTVWHVDGKDIRAILRDLEIETLYPYSIGSGSHSVHGDWYDISLYHIKRNGCDYLPKLDYDDPDPRLACSITEICLHTSLVYLKWSNGDQSGALSILASKLRQLNREVDAAHEATLGP